MITAVLLFLIVVLTLALLFLRTQRSSSASAPPFVPSTIPFLGNAVSYGIDPVKFLSECQKKYGDCFTFELFAGKNPLSAWDPIGNNAVFNAKLSQASAELAYKKLTTPVFGEGVVYDCDNAILMQQKKMAKDALTVQAFREYIPIIISETKGLMKEWGIDAGEIDLFHEMAELTIRTASSCLMGKEIRAQLQSNVAKLYQDLDGGLTPLNVFVSWLPTPRFIKRDRANRLMTETFKKIINERRMNDDMKNNDVLQTYMTATYKNGHKMSDDEIAHMMIALLMAGQHTSSTTSTWFLYRLAQNPHVIDALLKEQAEVLGAKENWKELPGFDYDQLKKMTLLDFCMKETLRLHPPIHTVMRVLVSEVEFKDYTIPSGHYICAAPCVSQLDPVKYPNPEKFDPWRHLHAEDQGEWSIDMAEKSAKSHYLPFGAGRHRCIGEAFAYVQVKTIVATLLRQYEISLVTNKKTGEPIFPEKDYTQLIVLPTKNSKLVLKKRD